MGNRYFETGDQRGAMVKELFATIASRYDLLNDLQSFGLHRYWKRHLVRQAHPRPGEHGLDVCCGTGDLTLALAGCGVQTTGLDFSEEMLEVARKRTQGQRRMSGGTQGLAGDRARFCVDPHFIRGDAQGIPFRDNTFEIVMVGYGLRNLADWKEGLREMQRVLSWNGRLVVLDFGKPDNRLWRSIYFGYLRVFVPILGRLVSGSASAYGYILESLKHYPAQRGIATAMQELGFINVRIFHFVGGAMTINYGEKGSEH